MKKIAMLLTMGFLGAFVSVSHAQDSLADLANKEKERREAVKNDRVITQEEVAKFVTEPEPSVEASQQPMGAEDSEKKPDESAKLSDKDNSDSDEPTDFEGRPESFWRKTMADARQKVTDLTNEANVIVLKIADLQNKFYSMDDGFKREDLQRELQKSYYEQDLNKKNLAEAKATVLDLENEARKSGALPGWFDGSEK